MLQKSAMFVESEMETSTRNRFMRRGSGLPRSRCAISLVISSNTSPHSASSSFITSGASSFCACELPGWITGRKE